jgi:hypothetical protein
MSGTIALTGPSTTPGATALDAPTVNAAVNAALATKAPLASPTFTGMATLPSVNIDGGSIDSTPIGATTPSTGAFTTLSASGVVSGAGFTTLLGSPPAIGGTTPATGKFTTIQSTIATGTAPFTVASTTVVANLNASTLGGATFANPGAIGSTPGSGNFTTLGATGLISPTSTVGIKGTIAADNAQAGSVGEFISSAVVVGSAVALTTATVANITSISLTAGDWDVWGSVCFTPTATTSITFMLGGITTTSASVPLPSTGASFAVYQAAFVPGSTAFAPTYPVGRVRISISSTTTVYLTAEAAFTVSTLGGCGFIGARRVR